MSEIRTPPRRLVDLNPRWIYSGTEIWGIGYDCPCGLPTFSPIYDENGKVAKRDDGKVVGVVPWEQCCPLMGRCSVPTNASLIGVSACADSRARGWDIGGNTFADISLSPSIHHVGHWHGFLRSGLLESC